VSRSLYINPKFSYSCKMTTNEAIDYFTSKRQLAFALDISPQAISGWGEYPPVLRQYQIQDITKQQLKVTSPLNTTGVTSHR